MGKQRRVKASGHKANWAKTRYREKWNNRHQEGRKIYSLKKKVKHFQRQIVKMERKIERVSKLKNLGE